MLINIISKVSHEFDVYPSGLSSLFPSSLFFFFLNFLSEWLLSNRRSLSDFTTIYLLRRIIVIIFFFFSFYVIFFLDLCRINFLSDSDVTSDLIDFSLLSPWTFL